MGCAHLSQSIVHHAQALLKLTPQAQQQWQRNKAAELKSSFYVNNLSTLQRRRTRCLGGKVPAFFCLSMQGEM
jgi:hypothetical protein